MAGRYQAYPEYKGSGVEWIGEMPIDWTKTRINTICYFQKGYGLSKGDLSENGSNPCILYGELYTAYKDFNEILKVKSKTDVGIGCLSEGDEILIPGSTTTTGIDLANANYLPHKGVLLGGDIIILKPRKEYNKRFVSYFITNVDTREFIRYSKGVTIYHIYASSIKDMPVFLPPLEDQNHIVSFLDYETAKIDTLIEKQQQLIKLLKEKRQAVISHAVTKGLNPDAPMRDSGVEWLGNVPSHWGVKRVGLLFSESSARASSSVELMYPVLSVSIHHGISDKELNEEELDRKVTRSEDKSLYKVVHNNDLAYNMMRAWQGGFGASTLSGLVSPAYVVCNPKTSMDSYYFELVLRTPNAVTELKRYSRGITDFRLRLYWDEFKNIRVPVPPSDEIDEILKSIQTINSKYDNLGLVAERQIKLLTERRTALISAAVTGKIDVRQWQAPEQKEA